MSAGKKLILFISIVFFAMILFTIFLLISPSHVLNQSNRYSMMSQSNLKYNESDLVGIWELQKAENVTSFLPFGKLEFFSDRTGIMGGNEITWQLKDGYRLYRNSSTIGSSNYDIEISENGTLLTYHYNGLNYKGKHPQKAMYRKVAKNILNEYYYEMFIIDKSHYLTISQPSNWNMSSIEDYRNKLKRSQYYKLLYSAAHIDENSLFTIFSNYGNSPSESSNILAYINNVGNTLFINDYYESLFQNSANEALQIL